MQRNQIEARVYDIVDRVKLKQPIEDDRIELKREWIDAKKAARLIAGHANASRSEPILWIFGIDEKAGSVPGVVPGEMSNWLNQLQAQFDESVCPDLTTHVNVTVDAVTVVAMHFATDRSPYVVKNPAGGEISKEVPWRKGTSTFSASRSQLLRLLSHAQLLPALEFLKGWLILKPNEFPRRPDEAYRWYGNVEFYIQPNSDASLAIPPHRRSATFEFPGIIPRTEFAVVIGGVGALIQEKDNEIVVRGPGHVQMELNAFTMEYGPVGDTAEITVEVAPAGAENSATVRGALKQASCEKGELGRWVLGKFWFNS